MEYFSNTIRRNKSRQLLLMPKMVTIFATLQLTAEDKFQLTVKYLQTTVDEHQRKAHGGTDKLYFKEVFNTQQWLWLEQNVEQLLIQGTSSILYWETNKVPEEKTLCGCTAKDHFFALVQTEIKQAPH